MKSEDNGLLTTIFFSVFVKGFHIPPFTNQREIRKPSIPHPNSHGKFMRLKISELCSYKPTKALSSAI